MPRILSSTLSAHRRRPQRTIAGRTQSAYDTYGLSLSPPLSPGISWPFPSSSSSSSRSTSPTSPPSTPLSLYYRKKPQLEENGSLKSWSPESPYSSDDGAAFFEDSPEVDAWGQFVDVAEAEEEIIRSSKILSKRYLYS